MIIRKIEQIEARVRQSERLPNEQKDALLANLAELKSEAQSVPQAKETDIPVESSVDASGPITPILNELSASIDGLEASHPRLTELTNRIALTLANMGI